MHDSVAQEARHCHAESLRAFQRYNDLYVIIVFYEVLRLV